MRHPWNRHRLVLAVLALIISLLTSMAWADSGPLPARDWNLENLQRLEKLKPNTLTFAVLGDSRSNPKVLESLLQQLGRDPGIDFAIHLGDMVEKGELEGYRSFFTAVRRYLKMPLLAAIGNHELAGDPTGKLFVGIFGPRYFSFQLHRNYFIFVDDNDKNGLGEEQERWLKAELQKAQAYKTRLVFLHVPLFDPRGGEHRHSLTPEAGRRLAALFKEYRVSRIFVGHIHSYFNGQWDGVPYTISAGAGAPLYGDDPRHFFYHYLKVSIRGDRVRVQVRRLQKEGE